MFNYIDDAFNFTYPLMAKLRQVLVEHALQNLTKTEEISILHKISAFEEELRRRLEIEVPLARRNFDINKGFSAVPNRVFDCQSYPIYQFVRTGLEMKPMRTISPGEDIEQVFVAICQGKHVAPLLRCIEGWTGAPGPYTSC